MQETKVQAIVYKFDDGLPKCLCLKRSLEDGGFWHVVTGTLEPGENWESCLKREIEEELGIEEILKISKVLKEWIWRKDDQDIKILDVAIIVGNQDIKLNAEHSAFEWLDLNSAEEKLEKDSAKEMIALSADFLTHV